jgi:hypothetical protein
MSCLFASVNVILIHSFKLSNNDKGKVCLFACLLKGRVKKLKG